jgi:hypothetical protein
MIGAGGASAVIAEKARLDCAGGERCREIEFMTPLCFCFYFGTDRKVELGLRSEI